MFLEKRQIFVLACENLMLLTAGAYLWLGYHYLLIDIRSYSGELFFSLDTSGILSGGRQDLV
jgi:hypothetical protein